MGDSRVDRRMLFRRRAARPPGCVLAVEPVRTAVERLASYPQVRLSHELTDTFMPLAPAEPPHWDHRARQSIWSCLLGECLPKTVAPAVRQLINGLRARLIERIGAYLDRSAGEATGGAWDRSKPCIVERERRVETDNWSPF